MNKKLLTLLLFIVSFSLVSVSYSQSAMLQCHTEGNGLPANSSCHYYINGAPWAHGTCFNTNPKVQIAVIDSCSFTPWYNDSCVMYFGQQNYGNTCGGYTCMSLWQNWYQFELEIPYEVDSLINMLNNKIPYGQHLLAYTYSVYNYSSLPQYNAFKNAFINLGSVMMNTLPDTVPFIFYVKKGYPWTVVEMHGNTASDTLDLYATMECNPTGVNEIENLNSMISLFPNPATDEFKVQSSKLKVEAVEVYDVVGKQMKALTPYPSPLREGGASIDVSELAPGIYFVRIKTEKGSVTKKLIKQ